MDNRIRITSILIKNFRSIRSLYIKTSDFNIFVGSNDAGKSNVLKALNLFFNNKIDAVNEFNYNRDFTYLYPARSKEAKVITISIHFDIPKTFSDGGEYVWEKRWGRDGIQTDSIKKQDGSRPGSRSRVPSTLRKIKFRYVPAVKSTDYYKKLLEDLYSSVSASLDSTLEQAANDFSEVLSTYTEHITKDVFEQLDLSSVLTVPSELNDIFKALVFKTARTGQKIEVPLTSRGDGIQARHIPIILKYIADEDQRSRNQGATKVTTIWGFEEPENGLELSNAFSMADEFIGYSKDVQIFLTTHSPAFYMTKGNRSVKVFFVEKKSGNTEETVIGSEKNSSKVATKMGLMPLVAPFVAEQEKKLREAEAIFNKNYLTDMPTILVEGKTDKEYLSLAIEHLSPELNKMLNNQTLRIVYKIDGAGCTQLSNWVFAWLYSGFKSPMMAIFDNDSAGIEARNTVVNSEHYKNNVQSSNIKVVYIQPSEDIINGKRLGVQFDYEIEHLLSEDVWREWKKKNLITTRTDDDLLKNLYKIVPRDKTLDETIEDLKNKGLKEHVFMYKPKDLKKTKMVECLRQSSLNVADSFKGFERTIKDMEAMFLKK